MAKKLRQKFKNEKSFQSKIKSTFIIFKGFSGFQADNTGISVISIKLPMESSQIFV